MNIFLLFLYNLIETGESKTIQFEEAKPSFFNFFSTLRLPQSKEEVLKLNFEDEKELGHHLDTEFEYIMEFIEEFIPHALDYYLGFKTESNEYSNYLQDHMKGK